MKVIAGGRRVRPGGGGRRAQPKYPGLATVSVDVDGVDKGTLTLLRFLNVDNQGGK